MVTVSWPWTLDVVDNGITSLGEWCDGRDPILSLAQDRVVRLLRAFLMSSISSLDHEIVQLPDTVGMLWVHQTSQHNWVIIKVIYRCLQWYLLSWRISRLGFVTSIVREVSLGPLDNAHHISLASVVTNELVARWCIKERVKRLSSNEIELGIEIPTIESRASNIPMTKGTTYVVMRTDR